MSSENEPKPEPPIDVEQFHAPLEEFREPWHPEIDRQLPLLASGHDLAWEGQDENGDRKTIVMRVTEYMDKHGNTVKAVEYAAGVAAVLFFSSLGVRRYKNGHLGPKTRNPK